VRLIALVLTGIGGVLGAVGGFYAASAVMSAGYPTHGPTGIGLVQVYGAIILAAAACAVLGALPGFLIFLLDLALREPGGPRGD
jgi:hypothetical protein